MASDDALCAWPIQIVQYALDVLGRKEPVRLHPERHELDGHPRWRLQGLYGSWRRGDSMKAGPQGNRHRPAARPSAASEAGGSRAVAFVERYVTVPKGTGARRRLNRRPWQREMAHGVLDEPRPRQALVSIPAGNGKSTLAAALGLYGLLADRTEGAQVICVASDERQARIILNTARRMVELDPALYARVQIFKDHLPEPHTDSTLFALPADPGALQGWDPSLAIVDEVHVVTDDTFEAMAARAGKREHSLLLAHLHPAEGRRRRRHAAAGRPRPRRRRPVVVLPRGRRPGRLHARRRGRRGTRQPGARAFLHRDALRAVLPPKMRENAFRRYRLGQWVQLDGAWLPDGAWAACADAGSSGRRRRRARFDGSFSGDCTALVAVTVEPRPHVHLVELWEAPEGRRYWRVPVVEVEDAIRACCRRWRVLQVAADPYRWARSLELLDADGIPVGEFPQSPARMRPVLRGRRRPAAVPRRVFRRRMTKAVLVEAARVVAQLCAFVGVVAGFWHITWIAGVGVLASGLVGVAVQSVGYWRLERDRLLGRDQQPTPQEGEEPGGTEA
jgi:Phage Terminase